MATPPQAPEHTSSSLLLRRNGGAPWQRRKISVLRGELGGIKVVMFALHGSKFAAF
ncbi:MAG: hypothetical protein RR412_06955 [Burkholderiaceae bacterium]